MLISFCHIDNFYYNRLKLEYKIKYNPKLNLFSSCLFFQVFGGVYEPAKNAGASALEIEKISIV